MINALEKMKQRLVTFLIASTIVIAVASVVFGSSNGRPLNPKPSAVSYLPAVFAHTTRVYDMLPLLRGDGRLYEVQHSSGSQARHQTQIENQVFFHTKGNEIKAEWEELWYNEQHIYRGTDTSPGNGMYYTLRDPGIYGSAWAPRYWRIGQLFGRNPFVTFYYKSDCTIVAEGYQQSWLKFEAFYPQYTFESGITLTQVVQLAWLPDPDGAPIERYFYGRDFGLVGWWSNSNAMSYVSEIHEPGTRPDNTREVIPCLDTSPLTSPPPSSQTLPNWPGEHRR